MEANCSTSENTSMAAATWWLPPDEQRTALELLHTECTLKDSFSAVYMSSEHDMWQPTPKRRSNFAAALAKAHSVAVLAEEEGRVLGKTNASETTVWLDVLVYFTRNTTGLNSGNDDLQYQSTVLGAHASDVLASCKIHELQDMLRTGTGSLVIPFVIDTLVKLSADAATSLYTSRGMLQGLNLTLNSQDSSVWWAVCCDASTDYCRDSAANPVLEDDDGCVGIWLLTSSRPVGGAVFRCGVCVCTCVYVCVRVCACVTERDTERETLTHCDV